MSEDVLLEPVVEQERLPEGYDRENSELASFPIDSLMIRTETRSVFEVARRIDAGSFIMTPDFQRDYVWDPSRQSKLIESAILRIPLPVFYLAETEDGKSVVVDGLQRLTTFYRFLNGDFALQNLDFDPSLNGKKFDTLDQSLKNRIEDTPLTLYLIDSKVPAEAKFEIFERVNGGIPLTRQQMRNCLFNGNATRWLADLVKKEPFTKATGSSFNSKTMRDRECVNRFAGFISLGWETYNGKMDTYLNEALRTLNRKGEDVLDNLGARFLNSMTINYKIFGKHAFRKSMLLEGGRTVINVALFDILSCYFTDWEVTEALARKDQIKASLKELLTNDDFVLSITYSTNSKSRVQDRFKMLNEALAPLKP